MTVRQGDIWWADLAEPVGSSPGYRRPVVVIQSDPFNDSGLNTIVCVVLTSSLRHAEAPGNVRLESEKSGLPKTSVANVTQIVTLDRQQLTEPVATLSKTDRDRVLAGVSLMLGRWVASQPNKAGEVS